MSSLPEEVDPLEALYTSVMIRRTPKQVKKPADPAEGTIPVDSTYSNPDNWERRRGIALIDKESNSLIGNFSEYVHKKFPTTRKLIREHTFISIDATEICEGYLGAAVEMRLKNQHWEVEHRIVADIQLDEMAVEAPAVQLSVKTRLGAVVRYDLVHETQFASASGGTILILPAETDILAACSTDTKARVRKMLPV